jgi:hypothetical protein
MSFRAGRASTRGLIMGGGDAMPNRAIDHVRCDGDRRRLQRLRALHEMFEEDCGRQAGTIEELREWMGAQYTDQLQVRMNRRLHGINAGILRYRRKRPALAGL